MQTTCLRSASRPLFREGFFNTSFSGPTTLSRPGAASFRLQLQPNQRQLHTSPSPTLFTQASTKHAARVTPSSTQLTLQPPQRRHESTTTTTSSSSPKPTPGALTWNDFFRLRQRRRYINVASSLVTSSITFMGGVAVVASQEIESLQFFGLDPLIASGLVCVVFGATGWLSGPLLGAAVFRVFVGRAGEISAKERDFYGRIRRYRVDPSSSSMQNPLPDYYGEKITSVQGYRRWLKDQKAFRRKRQSLL